MLPSVIGHADWGSTPGKRQLALAGLAAPGPGGRAGYRVVSLAAVPEPVAGGAGPLAEFARSAGPGCPDGAHPGPVLLGFDFPIGLPRAYAAAAGIGCFPRFLDGLSSPPWQWFTEVAEVSEVTLHRPFYPARPGGSSRDHLSQALGLTAGQLRRRFEQADAEITFWTLGPRQAGKAALHGWRLLQRARQETKAVLWPFEGPLAGLLRRLPGGPQHRGDQRLAGRCGEQVLQPEEPGAASGTGRGAGWSAHGRGGRAAGAG